MNLIAFSRPIPHKPVSLLKSSVTLLKPKSWTNSLICPSTAVNSGTESCWFLALSPPYFFFFLWQCTAMFVWHTVWLCPVSCFSHSGWFDYSHCSISNLLCVSFQLEEVGIISYILFLSFALIWSSDNSSYGYKNPSPYVFLTFNSFALQKSTWPHQLIHSQGFWKPFSLSCRLRVSTNFHSGCEPSFFIYLLKFQADTFLFSPCYSCTSP